MERIHPFLDKTALRKPLRAARRDIPECARRRAERSVLQRLAHLPTFRAARSVASYLAMDEEFPTSRINRFILASGKSLLLPVITDPVQAQMQFVRVIHLRAQQKQAGMSALSVPAKSAIRRHPSAPDLILLPLLGYDTRGNRLGMGGGYYDRWLAACPGLRYGRPRLLGLAFAVQQLPQIPHDEWDIRLHAVMTEVSLHLIRRR